MRMTAAILISLGLSISLAAQEPGRPAPLPDHWLTLDSLTTVLGLTAEQRAKVSDPYNALNAVLKQAANRRAQMRGTMRRPERAPDEMTAQEREAFRVRRDSVRAEFDGFQAEADEWHLAIRNLLTPAQQAKFDALPKPRVFPETRRRMGAPPG